MFHLQKRLIQSVVVIGADEDSGLIPRRPLKLTASQVRLLSEAFQVSYQAQILSTLTETTAIHPFRAEPVDPLYPSPEFGLPNKFEEEQFEKSFADGPILSNQWKEAWRQSSSNRKATVAGGGLSNKRLSRTVDKRQVSILRRTSALTKRSTKATGKSHNPSVTSDSNQNVSTETLEGLPYLLYPEGIKILKERCSPQIDYLVLTSMNGDRRHAVVLSFARAFRLRNRTREGKVNLLLEDDEDTFLEEIGDSCDSGTAPQIVYIPQSVILISQNAYFSLMKEILSLFYKAVEVNNENFNRIISKFSASVTNTPTSWGEANLVLEMTLFDHQLRIPPPLPLINRIVDFDLTLLTKSLAVDELIMVVCAMWMQRRIVVLSSNPVLSTLFCEGLLLLIRPFEWRFAYVPWLPTNQLEFLEAPGPFLFGFHSEFLSKSLQFGDILCVNLDDGALHMPAVAEYHIPEPPKQAMRKLKESLFAMSHDYEIFTLCNLEPMTIETVRDNREKYRRKNQKQMLLSFLKFSIDCFRCVLPFIQRREDSSPSNTQKNYLFKRELFLRSVTESKEFYTEVVSLEIFSTFLRPRFQNKQDAWAKIEQLTKNEMNTAPIMKTFLATISTNSMPTRSRSLGTDVDPYRESVVSNISFSNVSDEATPTTLGLCEIQSDEKFRYIDLPPYLNGRPDDFFRRFSEELGLRIQQEQHIPTKTGLLLLRADCRLFLTDYELAFQDLYEATKLGLFILKKHTFYNFLRSLDPTRLRSLQEMTIFCEVKRLIGYQDDGVQSNLALWELEMIQGNVMKQVPLPPVPLSEIDFLKFCQTSQISYCRDVQFRLFQSLTLGQENRDETLRAVHPKVLSAFYEIWTESTGSLEEEMSTDLLGDSEIIIKCSPEIRVDNIGSGRLIITESRVLFLSNGTRRLSHLFFHKDILDLQEGSSSIFSLKTTYSTLKIKIKPDPNNEDITSSSSSLQRSEESGVNVSRRSHQRRSSNMFTYVAWLKQKTHLWYTLLMELRSANLSAMHQRDMGLLSEAIDNCLLIDTFYNYCHFVTSPHQTTAIEKLTDYDKQLMQPQKLLSIEKHMASFTSKFTNGLYELPPLTNLHLIMKADVDPCDIFPKCVEAIVAVPRNKGSTLTLPLVVSHSLDIDIWCLYNINNGTQCGKLIVLDANEIQLERVVLSLNIRLQSLLLVGDRLWVGGEDHRIYIIHVGTKHVERILVEHVDSIIQLAAPTPPAIMYFPLTNTKANLQTAEIVLSATETGDLILWDANSLSVDVRWKLKDSAFLTSLSFCGDKHVLCVIRFTLFLYSCRGGPVLAEFSPKELPRPIKNSSLSSICVVPEGLRISFESDDQLGNSFESTQRDDECKTFYVYMAHGKNGLIHRLRISIKGNDKAELFEMNHRVVQLKCNAKTTKNLATCTVCQGDADNPCDTCANILSCYGISNLLYAKNRIWASCKDGQIFLFNTDLSEDLHGSSNRQEGEYYVYAHQGTVQTMCYSHEGSLLITGGRTDNRIALWDLSNLQQHHHLSLSS